MKITLNNTVEVDLPHYRRNTAFIYKAFQDGDEIKCLQVTYNPILNPSIIIAHKEIAWLDTEPCTREEFEIEFAVIFPKIKDIGIA